MSNDVVAEAVLHVDEHVAERLAVGADHVGFLQLRRPCAAFTQTGSAFILIGSFFGAVPSSDDRALDVAGRRRVDLLAAAAAAGDGGSADVLDASWLPPPHAATVAASARPRARPRRSYTHRHSPRRINALMIPTNRRSIIQRPSAVLYRRRFA